MKEPVIKLGIISDIHNGPNKETKVAKLLRAFVSQMNDNFKPAFVVVLGDLHTFVNFDVDCASIRGIKEIFQALELPVYYVLGNHDIVNLTKEKFRNILGIDCEYTSFNFGNYHFVLLDAQDETIGGNEGNISESQLRWLRNDLENTSKKTVIFSHQALDKQDLMQNIRFKDSPSSAFVKNKDKVREILDNSRKVIAVFNGHVHWNNMQIINNIPYFSIHSLVETWTTNGKLCGAYAQVYLCSDNAKVDILGRDPVNYIYSPEATKGR